MPQGFYEIAPDSPKVICGTRCFFTSHKIKIEINSKGLYAQNMDEPLDQVLKELNTLSESQLKEILDYIDYINKREIKPGVWTNLENDNGFPPENRINRFNF